MIEISKRDKILRMFRTHFQKRPLHEIIGSVKKEMIQLEKDAKAHKAAKSAKRAAYELAKAA